MKLRNKTIILQSIQKSNINYINPIQNFSFVKVEINKQLIDHVAQVARLRLSETEKKKFKKELKEIVEAFSAIDEVNTKDVDTNLQPVELKNVLREDTEGKCLTQEEALRLAKHKKDGYFKGPKVV